MSDLLALLDAVRAEPDDSLARGVLADWLDDRGDPRGAIVRASDELLRLAAEWPALRGRSEDLGRGPLLEGEDDDPDGAIAEVNRGRWEQFERDLEENDRACHACRDGYRDGGERLAELYAAWFASSRPEFASLGFDFETFCGFVNAVHARVSLFRRVRPELLSPHPIRTLYLTAGRETDTRSVPDDVLVLPHLRAVVLSADRSWTVGVRPEPVLGPVPETDDLAFVRDAPWLGRAETLALDLGTPAGFELLAWVARSLPHSRLPRLPAVRLLDPNPYTGWYAPAHAAAFCESELIDRVEDLDLGPLLAPLPVAEVDAILRRPFGTVRELGLEFRAVTPDGQAPGPFDDVEPALRAVLKEAESRWADDGRALRWRVVPSLGPWVHPARRVLRAYWPAVGATRWRPPALDDLGYEAAWPHDYADEDYSEGYHRWDDDGRGLDADDVGITPTRRELYRGRFRNPRPR